MKRHKKQKERKKLNKRFKILLRKIVIKLQEEMKIKCSVNRFSHKFFIFLGLFIKIKIALLKCFFGTWNMRILFVLIEQFMISSLPKSISVCWFQNKILETFIFIPWSQQSQIKSRWHASETWNEINVTLSSTVHNCEPFLWLWLDIVSRVFNNDTTSLTIDSFNQRTKI